MPTGYAGMSMSDLEQLEERQHLLNGKKTERIIFAVTPELKKAISNKAKDKCVSMSSFISSTLVDVILREGQR